MVGKPLKNWRPGEKPARFQMKPGMWLFSWVSSMHTPTRKRPLVWWRHFTTMTRILQGFAFLCKLRLLLFKPRWDYQIWIWKEKPKDSGHSSKLLPSCKWPIWIVSPWRSFAIFAITYISGHKLLFSSLYPRKRLSNIILNWPKRYKRCFVSSQDKSLSWV